MQPFGYINEAVLVGIGNCNNPLHGNDLYEDDKVVDKDALDTQDSDGDGKLDRSRFGSHWFVKLRGKIYDATVGPHTAELPDTYAAAAIDTSTAPEEAVAGDINNPAHAEDRGTALTIK
jgi:hypothetical protein